MFRNNVKTAVLLAALGALFLGVGSLFGTGGLYIGLALPLSAQREQTWDWNGSLTGDDRPGSWGGHAVDVVRYSAGSLTAVTWGRLQDLTWPFWDRYVDEAYCILSNDFLSSKRAPNGFDLDALKADLALVTA